MNKIASLEGSNEEGVCPGEMNGGMDKGTGRRDRWPLEAFGQTDRETDLGGRVGKQNHHAILTSWNAPFFPRADILEMKPEGAWDAALWWPAD